MAEGTLQILGLGTSAVPLEYTASGDQSLDLVAVNADYDGSSAMVDWQPVVEIISTAGHVMARGVGPKITAGDSASVTFAPFLKEQAAQTSGGGIQYGVRPQPGTFLQITTTDTGANSLNIASGGQMDVRSAEAMSLISFDTMEVSSDGAMTIDSKAGIDVTNITAGAVAISNTQDNGISVEDLGSAFSRGVTVKSDNAFVTIDGAALQATTHSDHFYINLGSGTQVRVINSSNQKIFEVRDDGSLHGLTGQSLTFDL